MHIKQTPVRSSEMLECSVFMSYYTIRKIKILDPKVLYLEIVGSGLVIHFE